MALHTVSHAIFARNPSFTIRAQERENCWTIFLVHAKKKKGKIIRGTTIMIDNHVVVDDLQGLGGVQWWLNLKRGWVREGQ